MKKFLCTLVFSAALLFGCGGGGNTTTPPPTPEVTVSITASPPTINQGGNCTLTWTSTNADRVEISGVPEATSPSGVVTVAPQVSTTYVVTAYGVRESAPVSVTVTVITLIVPPPPPPPPPPVFPVYITATWVMPTTYDDGTPLDPATVSVLLYMKSTADPFTDLDLPIAEALPGATSVDFGPVDVNRGATYYFSCKAKTSTGEISVFSPVVVHIWN